MWNLRRQYAWKRALVRWFGDPDQRSPVRSKSRRRGLSWTKAEQKIRRLHRAALDDLSEEASRRLYGLELSASRHAGESPRVLLERAKRVVRRA